MKKLFLWLMAGLLIIGSTNEANARSKKKKGKAKTEQQADSVQKKKRVYTINSLKTKRNTLLVKEPSPSINMMQRFTWKYRLN